MILKYLKKYCSDTLNDIEVIPICLNLDGLPLYSTPTRVWPLFLINKYFQ